jgi:putative hemolysin
MSLHLGEVLATKDGLAWPSSWVTLFPLPHGSLRVGERGFDQVVTQLYQLTEPITSACDRYVQYLLTEANTLVLNRHRWWLQP